MNILKHVALIPDGNRRWAQKKGLFTLMGHQKGAETLEDILNTVLSLKIPYFTFWGSSLDNITKRTKEEVRNLFIVFEDQFNRVINNEDIHKNKVKIQIIGKWKEYFPESTKIAMEKAIDCTKDYNNFLLTFLMAYNGTDEMIDCIKKIKGEVTEEKIKENLWTKNLPDVDFIIRTGCKDDPHNSTGFMMWKTSYSQLYFTNKLFPDFKGKEFEKAIENYSERERRKGS
ncbi:MAG: polyprenyl diphosphate synthase [Candidatus Pacebacteria bacterium]|nr:polyprenyl diphosphate synthase [Candidatus Paceibacterota bacterium]MDD4074161.1 polyprenyl diphosphate synthase [Candidatus Paceibacterota bacterium]